MNIYGGTGVVFGRPRSSDMGEKKQCVWNIWKCSVLRMW